MAESVTNASSTMRRNGIRMSPKTADLYRWVPVRMLLRLAALDQAAGATCRAAAGSGPLHLYSQRNHARLALVLGSQMTTGGNDDKTDVRQGTLALMVLKVLEALGPQHGFGIAQRIEQTSGQRLVLNPGTLYPTLIRLEQEGAIKSSWGTSDNNRRARFYRLTRAGRAQIERETREWRTTTDILARFLVLENPR